jgi:hypothetical protein
VALEDSQYSVVKLLNPLVALRGVYAADLDQLGRRFVTLEIFEGDFGPDLDFELGCGFRE